MHSLEAEFRTLHAQGVLDDATVTRVVAIERGDMFPVHREVRALLYGGVLLVTVGVGTLLARNLDRLGPAAITVGIAIVAALAAAPAWRARRTGRPLGPGADYLLLLAVLLAGADLGYAEAQFRLLGPAWPWHFAIVAVASAVVAHVFDSKLVLAVSLASLAAWFGVGASGADPSRLWSGGVEFGARALSCATLVAAWKVADLRLRPQTRFGAVFDHYAATLAYWGALAWCLRSGWSWAGLPIVGVLSAVSVRHGLLASSESFIVYGVGYAALGLCFVVLPEIDDTRTAAAVALVVVAVASAAIWGLRRRMKERDA